MNVKLNAKLIGIEKRIGEILIYPKQSKLPSLHKPNIMFIV